MALFTAALRISGLESLSRSLSWLEVMFLALKEVRVIGRRMWMAQAPAGSPAPKSGLTAGSERMAPLWHLNRHLLFLNSLNTHRSSVVRGGWGKLFCEFCIWLSIVPASIGGSCAALERSVPAKTEAGTKPDSNKAVVIIFINSLPDSWNTFRYYQKSPGCVWV